MRARLDTPYGWLAGNVGWGLSGGQLTAGGSTNVDGKAVSSWTETIDSEGLPKKTVVAGEAAAGTKWHRLETSVKISRTLYPTFDGDLAFEERLAGTASIGIGSASRPLAIALSPFAARTHVWRRDMTGSRIDSRGATLHVGRDVTKLLRIDGIGELGVSPYARLDGDRAPTSQLGGQVLVALSARKSR